MKNWTSFISLRFFQSKKQGKLTNFITYLSIITTILAVAGILLTLTILRALHNNLIDSLQKDYGYATFSKKDHSLFDKQEILERLSYFDNVFIYEAYKPVFGLIYNSMGNSIIYIKDHDKNNDNDNDKNILTINDRIAHKLNISEDTTNQEIKIATLSVQNEIELLNVKIDKIIYSLPCTIPTLYISQSNYSTNTNKIDLIIFNLKEKTSEKKIQKELKLIQQAFPEMHISIFQENHQSIMNSIKFEKNCVYIVITVVIILLILINFFSIAIFMSSKKEFIQIIKTQGAKRKDIITIFTKYNIIIATIGLVFGILLGYMLCQIIIPITFKSINIQQINIPIYKQILYSDLILIIGSTLFVMIFSPIIMGRSLYSIEF